MKTTYIKIISVGILCLNLTSCGLFHKKQTAAPAVVVTASEAQLLENIKNNNVDSKFITSRMKFTVEVGVQKMTLTGNLKMKRDDVIQLQLMAFGFVEAGRIELTQDYVLIIDRINKLFLKVPYQHINFLRQAGLNFYVLQALFWNELFMPGQTTSEETVMSYTINLEDTTNNAIISYNQNNMSYRWLADKNNNTITLANILYKNQFKGNSQLTWNYDDFLTFQKKLFPHKMDIVYTNPNQTVNLGIVLNYMGKDSEWETRTKVSNKYKEVDVDEILQRFMAL